MVHTTGSDYVWIWPGGLIGHSGLWAFDMVSTETEGMMGIQEVYRRNRCGAINIDHQDATRPIRNPIHRGPPHFSPPYNITLPMLCPKCDKDLEKWLEGQGVTE